VDGGLGFGLELEASREDAIGLATEALKDEGFGVLTRIDVDEVFESKIGGTHHPYTILGACNPVLAHKALEARSDVGLLLPCNVTVEENPAGTCVIRFADPEAMMAMGGLGSVKEIADVGAAAKERLRRVADALAATSGRPQTAA
jgi:uncharacterized protein (DUF302 family)